ncbi:hypothetical protein BpHYR1_014196 [Brachionus plicatilis]|uniref:Uncharacterized protein n=1 Tax=Brachionus plicatilis TaxID=10195 RepID=A0A3M7S9U9_BRAPC|nr:hypothetical protein BpHYR1_014196 [Brachionus plicatilis]
MQFEKFSSMMRQMIMVNEDCGYINHIIFYFLSRRDKITKTEKLVKFTYFVNVSFCKQTQSVEKKIHIDTLDYSPKTSLVNNRGLVDSIEYDVSLINNSISYYCYEKLFLLKKINYKQ